MNELWSQILWECEGKVPRLMMQAKILFTSFHLEHCMNGSNLERFMSTLTI